MTRDGSLCEVSPYRNDESNLFLVYGNFDAEMSTAEYIRGAVQYAEMEL
jgi:hypothetical protein